MPSSWAARASDPLLHDQAEEGKIGDGGHFITPCKESIAFGARNRIAGCR
jgi:hypothetical protein